MTTKNLKKFFEEKDFNVNLVIQDGVQSAELETWTEGGVNMIMWLSPFTIEEFEESVDNFDVDEEIELHRQRQDYKEAFTIRQSLEDFEGYLNRLSALRVDLKNIMTFLDYSDKEEINWGVY